MIRCSVCHKLTNGDKLNFQVVEVSLKGRGPFTVFAPNAEALEAAKRDKVHDYTSHIFW